jgi:hypothetical protein
VPLPGEKLRRCPCCRNVRCEADTAKFVFRFVDKGPLRLDVSWTKVRDTPIEADYFTEVPYKTTRLTMIVVNDT